MSPRPSNPGLSPAGVTPFPRGTALLTNSLLNKGTAFTERERDALGLRGLLPPRVFTLEQQVARVLGASAANPIEPRFDFPHPQGASKA